VIYANKHSVPYDCQLRQRSLLLGCVMPLLILFNMHTQAQTTSDLPPCDQRPHTVDAFQVDASLYCLEQVAESSSRMAFTALLTGPDGTLYATSPHSGQVVILSDTVEVIAEGLTLPNALAYHDGALYIAGGPHLYRWRDGELDTLVDDLPFIGGLWTGGLAVFEDYLVVGVSAPYDFCLPGDEQASILRFDLNGENREVIAKGLRQPAGIAAWDGVLWITDTAHGTLTDGRFDEINRLEFGAHYGWPFCLGADNQASELPSPTDFDCGLTQAPAFTFRTGSSPVALVPYQGSAFPFLDGSLLVALMGSHNQSRIEGYLLAALKPDESGALRLDRVIAPSPVDAGGAALSLGELRPLLYRGEGFWPHHVYGLAVSPEGWIYLSAGSTAGSAVYVLRP
jgi:hypothetical protein